MEQRHFCQASLEYVLQLQEVHERKKFEFVETVILIPRSIHIDSSLRLLYLWCFIYFPYHFFLSILFSVIQLLGFMYGWLTFYHQGYEVAKEFRPYMTDLQVRLQKVSKDE